MGIFVPNFFDRLREERERLALSQQALAEKCGVTARSQRNYESGERNPDSAYLAAIAAAGADVLYILTGQRAGGVKPAPALTAEEETMLGYFRDASKEVRRAALGALLGARAADASAISPVVQVIRAAGSRVAGRNYYESPIKQDQDQDGSADQSPARKGRGK